MHCRRGKQLRRRYGIEPHSRTDIYPTTMNTLIIFLKYPEAGKVKTRLAEDIGADKAADLYSSMAMKIIDNTADPENYITTVFYDPPSKLKEIRDWIGEKEVQFSPQTGKTLGDKISNAFKEVFDNGSDKAVIIGTDCIDVTSDTINHTVDMLNQNDIILGPAEDGGYYLLGLKKHIPQIFEKIDWSTDCVLNQTIEKLNKHKLKYHLLKTLRDIDDVYDLRGVIKDL